VQETPNIDQIQRLLQFIIKRPQKLHGVLDKTTHQQVLSDLRQIKEDIAQAQDSDALIEVFVRLDRLLQESGIKAALTKKPSGADRLTPEEKRRIREKMQDSAWVARQKELWENTMVQAEHVLKTALPRQPEEPGQPS
jgi:hypothetical protein